MGDLAGWVFVLVELAAVLVPLVAIGVFVRMRWLDRKGGEPSRAFITVAHGLSAVVLAFMVLFAVLIVVSPSRVMGNGVGRVTVVQAVDGVNGDTRVRNRLMLRMPERTLELCPRGAVSTGPGEIATTEDDCWAKRHLTARYGPGTSVAPVVIERRIDHPDAGTRRTLSALMLLEQVGFILAVLAIERLLSLAAARRPFAPQAIRWMRGLAAGVAIVAVLVPELASRFADGLVRDLYGPTGLSLVGHGADIPPSAYAAVLGILALAEIWRYGIRLQEESEATI